MKHLPLRTLDLDEHRFESPFGPVLNGVAHGLANLFPPVETAHGVEDVGGEPRTSETGSDEAEGAEGYPRS